MARKRDDDQDDYAELVDDLAADVLDRVRDGLAGLFPGRDDDDDRRRDDDDDQDDEDRKGGNGRGRDARGTRGGGSRRRTTDDRRPGRRGYFS